MSAGSALSPRKLFGDTNPDLLFALATPYVPLATLAGVVAPPPPVFLSAETAIPVVSVLAVAPLVSAATASAPPASAPPASVPPASTSMLSAATPDPIRLAAADQALRGAVARQQSGATGQGVVIGILSDSFDTTGLYASDVANGLLNPDITVLKEGPAGSSDEGRAMAQLIHQIAPDARIMFYTGFGGQADFANGIRALAAAGASVIVDDVTYLNEPFYQDGGAIQAAVARAVASGISYFTSASNQGGNFYESAFTPLTTALPGLSGSFVAADFGTPGAPSPFIAITIARGATATLDLQWDAPFASIGASAGAQSSLGMVLYDANGRIVAYALRSNVGGDPVEILQFTNNTAATGFRLAIVTDGGHVLPGQFKFIAYGQGASINDPRAGIGSGSIIGHEMVPEANTVGAIAYDQTREFGGNREVEPFSSRGPGSYLFDAAGNRLAAPLRSSGVDYVAPDGSATSVFNPFYGTSAAAPNAAAVAALMLQLAPNLTPAQLSAALAGSATPARGPAGSTGTGVIDARAAVKMAMAMAGPAGQSNSFKLPAAPPMPAGTVLTSAAIRNAASAIAAAYDALPDTVPYSAAADAASGLALAHGDSLGGADFGNLALLHMVDPTPGSLYDPVHLLN